MYLPVSTYIRFSELPPGLLAKKFCDNYEFSNENLGSEKREKNKFFCKLNIKDLYSYIYNDKNIYKFIKKCEMKKISVSFNKKTPLYAGPGSKHKSKLLATAKHLNQEELCLLFFLFFCCCFFTERM